MNSAREILDAHETAQRRAYACAVFFICAALLANSVSFGVAYFFSHVGDFSAISPYAISAYLDLAIAAGFIFGFAPFASLRLKAIAAAGFFAYLEYSSTGIFGTGCLLQLLLGALIGLLSVRLPLILTLAVGIFAASVAVYIDINLFLK